MVTFASVPVCVLDGFSSSGNTDLAVPYSFFIPQLLINWFCAKFIFMNRRVLIPVDLYSSSIGLFL